MYAPVPFIFSLMSQTSTFSKLILVAICLVMLMVGAIAYFGYYQREYYSWSGEIRLWNGTKLQIRRHSSQRIYHGGHGFGWGGGDPWGDIRFTVGGRDYQLEGPYTPIAVQPDEDGTVYVVVYDRESEKSVQRHYFFRIYRNRGTESWDEIKPDEFPKHLAIQNTWLNRDNGGVNEYKLVAKMDPADGWFRLSLTAALWCQLDRPELTEPTESFVREFKTKWIRPISQQSPDGVR
jgi:hypothetical protein